MLKIKLFDENHEKDLEKEMNLFITSNSKIKINDIKYPDDLANSLLKETNIVIRRMSINDR